MAKVRKYYISFKRKYGFLGRDEFRRARYVRVVWPILFDTREEAQAHMESVDLFKNRRDRKPTAWHSARLVSASINSTFVVDRRGGV